MLKQIPGRETYTHTCNQGAGQPEVNLHDTHAYMVIDGKLVHIKYCPYCGIEIDNEERM